MKTRVKQFGVYISSVTLIGLYTLLPYSVFAQFTQPPKPEGSNLPDTLLGSGGVFHAVANILLLIIGAVAVIMLIIGGFRYVVSAGDSSAIEGAKNTILYAIIGIVVAFLAYAAINFLTGELVDSVPDEEESMIMPASSVASSGGAEFVEYF